MGAKPPRVDIDRDLEIYPVADVVYATVRSLPAVIVRFQNPGGDVVSEQWAMTPKKAREIATELRRAVRLLGF